MGEYNIQPWRRGGTISIDVSGMFTPAETMHLALVLIETAQREGVQFTDPAVKNDTSN